MCDIVKPKIGILTGISYQHLALFGSFENIKKAKYELIDSLPKDDGLALFNGENKFCLDLAVNGAWPGKKIIYKKLNNFNLLRFVNRWPEYYLENLQAAVEVAKYLEMSDEEIEKAFKKIKIENNLFQTSLGKNGIFLIDNSYNANPDGVLANLNYLKSQPYLKKILIMPCLIELGEESDEIHYEIGKAAKNVVDLAIITTPDYFNSIKRGMGDKAVLITSPFEIRNLLSAYLGPKTAILLQGRVPEVVKNFLIK